jgi:Tfp pilus assembly protein PilO
MPKLISMKKKNPILKTILSTLAILLLSTAIIIFIIYPAVNYIKKLKIEIQKIEQDSEDQYQKIKLLKKSVAELDTIKEKSKLLEQSLVNKDDAIKLIKELEELAISKNVEQSLNIKEGINDSFVFGLAVRGTFYETLQYLHSLEHLPFYVAIDSLNWTKVDQQNVLISFNATVFVK